jgi:ABC-type uncharacterized transport system ATPase subunit
LLTAENINKRFGPTVALDGVDFSARFGEIHALLGENGAGKSTLMSIIAGGLTPDSGHISLDGRALQVGSPQSMLAAGIAVVHQTPMLFDRFTWQETLALGGFGNGRFDSSVVASAAAELAARLGFTLPPLRSLVGTSASGDRVRLEILLALSFNPRVLALDEPTSVLAPGEIEAFLGLLRALRADNRTVILVTHRLSEARAVADRITVLRRGQRVATVAPEEADEARLAELMIGALPQRNSISPVPSPQRAGPVMELSNVSFERYGRQVLDRINLALRPGEIIGIAGIDGNGQRELVELIAGAIKPSSGRVIHDGVAVVPQDRDRQGFVLGLSLWENLLLDRAWRDRLGERGWVDREGAIEQCRRLIERYAIRAAGPASPTGTLSGGNRQRLQVARAIGSGRRVVVVHDAWRGLDIAATAMVSEMIADFARHGGAVLLVGGELDELIALSTRLMVINAGRLHEVPPDQRDAAYLGVLMAGGIQ